LGCEKTCFFGKKPDFYSKKRGFSDVYRRPNLTMWDLLGWKIFTGVDFKELKDYLQIFWGNLYPRGV
jgi:hypothetical protein